MWRKCHEHLVAGATKSTKCNIGSSHHLCLCYHYMSLHRKIQTKARSFLFAVPNGDWQWLISENNIEDIKQMLKGVENQLIPHKGCDLYTRDTTDIHVPDVNLVNSLPLCKFDDLITWHRTVSSLCFYLFIHRVHSSMQKLCRLCGSAAQF